MWSESPPVSVDHYENFPVASVLCPPALRPAIRAIYRFARTADDLADEGHASPGQRLADLAHFRGELNAACAGRAAGERWRGVFEPLAHCLRDFALPPALLHDLLDAFEQDVRNPAYADRAELLDYCRRSANPVGRLLLHLYDEATPVNIAYSDAICTSLQLINFWQDVAKDYAIGRIYLPQDEMAKCGITEEQIAQGIVNDAWRELIYFQTRRARAMMLSGAPLGSILTGRIGMEMRMIIAGGLRILSKLEDVRFDMFRRRPVLRPHDWFIMVMKSAPFIF